MRRQGEPFCVALVAQAPCLGTLPAAPPLLAAQANVARPRKTNVRRDAIRLPIPDYGLAGPGSILPVKYFFGPQSLNSPCLVAQDLRR
jgi:hypothetical protein